MFLYITGTERQIQKQQILWFPFFFFFCASDTILTSHISGDPKDILVTVTFPQMTAAISQDAPPQIFLYTAF